MSAVAEKLKMDHLSRPSPEEMKERLEDVRQKSSSEPEPEDDKRSKEEYAFTFEHRDATGRMRRGEFVNRVLKIKDKQMVAAMSSDMNFNKPLDSLPAITRTVNYAIAHMTYSLEKKPDWAKDMTELFDEHLVLAVFQEVDDHEKFFLGRGEAQKDS